MQSTIQKLQKRQRSGKIGAQLLQQFGAAELLRGKGPGKDKVFKAQEIYVGMIRGVIAGGYLKLIALEGSETGPEGLRLQGGPQLRASLVYVHPDGRQGISRRPVDTPAEKALRRVDVQVEPGLSLAPVDYNAKMVFVRGLIGVKLAIVVDPRHRPFRVLPGHGIHSGQLVVERSGKIDHFLPLRLVARPVGIEPLFVVVRRKVFQKGEKRGGKVRHRKKK